MKIDNFILVKCLGKNSFSEFYLSYMKDKNKYFFAKRINIQIYEKKSFLNKIYESKILNILNHPNIGKLEALKRTKNHIYIFMEYINGGNLSNCLKKYMEKHSSPFSEEIV